MTTILIIAATVAYILFTFNKYGVKLPLCEPCIAFWIALIPFTVQVSWFGSDFTTLLYALPSGAIAVYLKRYME